MSNRMRYFTAVAISLATTVANAHSLIILHNFANRPDASHPEAALLNVGGTLYGTSYSGGAFDRGSVYAIDNESGVETVLYSFKKKQDGAYPRGDLAYIGGTLYGTTTGGGSAPGTAGSGTIFAINVSSGAESVLYAFPSSASEGAYPIGALVHQAGMLYGVTEYGGDAICECGTVFAYSIMRHTQTVLHRFVAGADGAGPFGGLIAANGMLYGTTAGGGTSGSGYGTMFSVDPSTDSETVVYSFQGYPNDGESPLGNLIYANGFFYGTTQSGGPHTDGTVFSFNLATGSEVVLHGFAGGSDGSSPSAGLVFREGQLFGTTREGGSASGLGDGTIFQVDASTGAETVLHSFTGADGVDAAAPIRLIHGALFGVTFYGGRGCGREGCGTAFKLGLQAIQK